MPTEPLPLIEARGDHREVGRQIGEALRPQIQRHTAALPSNLPVGVTLEEMLSQSRLYLAPTRADYPQYTAEMEGIADGAGVAFERVFLSHCEELWESAAWRRGCTDLVARGRATADGSTLVIDPCVPDDWPGYAMTWRAPGSDDVYEIEVTATDGVNRKVVGVACDGVDLDPVAGTARIPLAHDGSAHRVLIRLGSGGAV